MKVKKKSEAHKFVQSFVDLLEYDYPILTGELCLEDLDEYEGITVTILIGYDNCTATLARTFVFPQDKAKAKYWIDYIKARCHNMFYYKNSYGVLVGATEEEINEALEDD